MPAEGSEAVTLKQLKMWGDEKLTGGAGSIADLVYPVGAIYLSASSTSPQTLFGGTWQRIQDRFLLCAGSTYKAGKTGGEASHTLTIDEIPSHSHVASSYKTQVDRAGYSEYEAMTANGDYPAPVATGAAGGGQAHNNMPPYLAVYAWQRVA